MSEIAAPSLSPQGGPGEPRAAATAIAGRRPSRIGAVSLGVAAAGAVATHLALHVGPWPDAIWLRLLAGAFEAGVVGGLADWFAVTALFRHPLGIPIPHTAILPRRRARIVDGIVTMVETDWLSPAVIEKRLARVAPSDLVLEWLGDRQHATRLAAPARDLLAALAGLLRAPEATTVLERLLRERLADLPSDRALADALAGALDGPAVRHILASLARSLANFADRPSTAATLQWWIQRSAERLRAEGQRVVPFLLRRHAVQRRLVDAACAYASSELRSAASDPDHPLRRSAREGLLRLVARLREGDPATQEQMARVRRALGESLDVAAIVEDALAWTAERLARELADPASPLSGLVERELVDGIRLALADPRRRASFDEWVRTTALGLVARHHDQIGLTVRENLDALDTASLVDRIEARVGDDLQYVRLNGALVGGLIGLGIAALRLLLG